MILIVANADDEHANIVSISLNERGLPFARFDASDLPTRVRISQRFSTGASPTSTLEADGLRFRPDDISTVWYRRAWEPIVSSQLEQADTDFAFGEAKNTLRGLWCQMGDRRWINPYLAALRADVKAYQLQTAASVGLKIPDTLITNNPEDAISFWHECGGRMIYKPFRFPAREIEGKFHGVYTNLVTLDQLRERQNSIAEAPCIFQRYVEKRVELRVTVVGTKCFAAEIHSQRSERSRLDWRRYDFANVSYNEVELPVGLQEKLSDFMSCTGLVFGCFDLIHSPDGEFVFLEVNQSGQWYWIEALTHMPILDAFVSLLTS
jgi:glutathione synthase/RimK-type ligase-like ATP-grasp enzyme